MACTRVLHMVQEQQLAAPFQQQVPLPKLQHDLPLL